LKALTCLHQIKIKAYLNTGAFDLVLNKLQGLHDQLHEEVVALQTTISQLQTENGGLKERIVGLKKANTHLENEVAFLHVSVDELHEEAATP
jgi:predicted  nucleic acid-binding Zn-ribbon protein